MGNTALNRHEIKYYINHLDYYNIARKISSIFTRDSNSSMDGGYTVRSLYFDNKSNKDYYQKIGGIEIRKKIRIRIYNYDDDPVKMEIKGKFNNFIKKESFVLRKKDINKIISGDYGVLLEYGNPTAVKIYKEFLMDFYRPVVLIDYRREAYSYDLNQIRITLDSDLRKTETGIDDLFVKKEMSGVLGNRKIILEIKFNNALPGWIKNILQLPRFERCSISKYTLSRYIER
jgi:SPX domain protein involved in polyphosphate accumulation